MTTPSMAATGLVGAVVDRVEFPVEEGKIREFAVAIGDPNPVYRDRAAAVAAGHAGIPAPPTFSVVAGHVRDQAAVVTRLGLDLRRTVFGECRWEYLAPVHAGDRLTATRVVRNADERPGRRGGSMRFITMETEVCNQMGDVVIRQHETLIETAATG